MGTKACGFLALIFTVSLFILPNEHCWVVAAVKAQCIDSEQKALLRFKEGFTTPSNYFSSWVAADQHCCNWIGVVCNNQTGHVVALDLHNSNSSEPLQGEFRNSLLDLPYLSYLDLSFNDFHQMQIPEFLGSLYSLEYLNLSHANFRGTVPDQLGNLSSLQFLDLSGNRFSLKANNLNWISGLSSLKVIDLGGVDLSTSVNWLQAINMLPSLVELCLFCCQLPSLQQSLHSVNFTSLEVLDLSYNNFYSAIPNWLSETSHTLRHLNISRCHLQGSIPDAFANFTSLIFLDFSYNDLTDLLPPSFGNLTSLDVLDLSFNRLEGPIPSSFGMIQELRELRLSYNKLNGSLETILPQLSELVILEVASNSLQGVITEAHLHNSSSLRMLDLSANQQILNFSSNWIPAFQLEIVYLQRCKMGPRFPQWLQNQKKVLRMDISHAGISDTVPAWFWNLSPSIERLNLCCNSLRGNIPDLSSRASLLALDLSKNLLGGSLPHFPPNVESLVLSENSFSGSVSHISDIMNERNRLSHLDLSGNRFSGHIPDCWKYGENMVFLDLGSNVLSGRIPLSIGHLVNLKVLTLSGNNFSGELPASLRKCTSLFSLNLVQNSLSGFLPAWIGESLENLQILLLRGNLFEGNIPLQVCQLKYISILDLSSNSLSGPIPACINSFLVIAGKDEEHSVSYYDYASYARDEMKKWMWINSQRKHGIKDIYISAIDISSNNLTGEIPREVTDLIGLMLLNLSNNQLTGLIPYDIGAMNNLEALDLSMNQLSCTIPPSMSRLFYLSLLNLSHNKLSGKVPSDNQFATFDETSYLKNLNLCGSPLTNICSEDASYEDPNCMEEEVNNKNKEADSGHRFEIPGFYISMGLGFIAGFWGFWAPLLIKTSWRHAYFRFISSMIDQIYVWMVVAMVRMQRKLKSPQEIK